MLTWLKPTFWLITWKKILFFHKLVALGWTVGMRTSMHNLTRKGTMLIYTKMVLWIAGPQSCQLQWSKHVFDFASHWIPHSSWPRESHQLGCLDRTQGIWFLHLHGAKLGTKSLGGSWNLKKRYTDIFWNYIAWRKVDHRMLQLQGWTSRSDGVEVRQRNRCLKLTQRWQSY